MMSLWVLHKPATYCIAIRTSHMSYRLARLAWEG